MKHYRLLTLAFLVLFSSVITGIQYHSHSVGHEPLTAHCKTCHLVHAVFDSVRSTVLNISEVSAFYQPQQVTFISLIEIVNLCLGRAPPIW